MVALTPIEHLAPGQSRRGLAAAWVQDARRALAAALGQLAARQGVVPPTRTGWRDAPEVDDAVMLAFLAESVVMLAAEVDDLKGQGR
jgi:hypothetical protein